MKCECKKFTGCPLPCPHDGLVRRREWVPFHLKDLWQKLGSAEGLCEGISLSPQCEDKYKSFLLPEGWRKDSAKVKGFTSLELMIVLTIFGVMTAISLPGILQFTARQRLQSEALRCVSALRLAQSRAVATGVWHEVKFDPGRDRYSVWRVVWDGGLRDDQPVAPAHQTDERINLSAASFFGLPNITFYPDGSTNATGEVRFTDGRETWRIGVLASTGKVTVTDIR